MDQTVMLSFDLLCRTCMSELSSDASYLETTQSEQQWRSVFDEIIECDSINIAELISRTVPQIKIKNNDKLPNKICYECFEKLQSTYQFQKLCLQSHMQMHKLISNKDGLTTRPILKESIDNLPQKPFLKEEFIDCRDDNDIHHDTEYIDEIHQTPQSIAADPLQSSILSECLKTEPSSDFEPLIDQSDSGSSKEDVIVVTTDQERLSVKDVVPLIDQTYGESQMKDLVVVATEKDDENETLSRSPTYTCSQCNKSFRKNRYLQMHMNRHSILVSTEEELVNFPLTTYSCSLCNKRFQKRRYLQMHLKRHKTRSEKQQEQVIEDQKGISEKQKEKNEDIKKDSIIVSTDEEPVSLPSSTHSCSLCNKTFKKRRYLQMHLIRNKKCAEQQVRQQRNEKCDMCNRSFVKQETLRFHRLKHHSKANNQSRFACEICKSTFSSRITLANHDKSKHSKRQQNQPCDEQRGITVKSKNKMKDYSFKCDTCDRSFFRQESLRFHRLRRHTKANSLSRYTCDICEKTFLNRITLACHDKFQHSEVNAQRYSCKFCNKNCRKADGLTAHLRTHTGERPYLCSECGKSFAMLDHLQNHIARHSEEKKLECPYCPKMFRCSTDLSRHKRVHRAVKKYICDICGYKTAESHLLTKHKIYHTGEKPHKCDYCEMRFVRADQQRRHMRTHTGEKPYKCKYCERAFAQGNDLIKHLRSHLGDNVYRCELCPLGFRLARDLRAHFTTHKNDDEETRERNMEALREENAKLELKLSANEIKQVDK